MVGVSLILKETMLWKEGTRFFFLLSTRSEWINLFWNYGNFHKPIPKSFLPNAYNTPFLNVHMLLNPQQNSKAT